jgi:hypothetical protein
VFNTQTAQWKRQGKIEGMTDKKTKLEFLGKTIDLNKFIENGEFVSNLTSEKDIDNLLSEIKETDFYEVSKKFPKINKDSGKDVIKHFFRMFKLKKIQYLKEDLKLIRIIFQTENLIIYSLTKKGKEVVEYGGWGEYSKNKKIQKKTKEKRSTNLYYTNLIIPILSTTIALIAVIYNKVDSRKITEQKEYIIQLEKSIEKDRNVLMNNIDSLSLKYHKDIRILYEKIEKKKENE